MFRWLYLHLFARRIKFVLECRSEDGTLNRAIIRVWNPDEDDFRACNEQVDALEEQGWTVKFRPRRLP